MLVAMWVRVSALMLSIKNESGQATAEYGVVILIAVALGMAVLALFTGGVFNSLLNSMISSVLKMATNSIHM